MLYAGISAIEEEIEPATGRKVPEIRTCFHIFLSVPVPAAVVLSSGKKVSI